MDVNSVGQERQLLPFGIRRARTTVLRHIRGFARDRPSRYGGRGFNGCQFCRARVPALAVRDLASPNYRLSPAISGALRGTGPRATNAAVSVDVSSVGQECPLLPFGIWRARTTVPCYIRGFARDRPSRYGRRDAKEARGIKNEEPSPRTTDAGVMLRAKSNYLMTTILPTLFRRVSPWRAVNL